MTKYEEFLKNWDEGDTDNPPTKMQKELDEVIIEKLHDFVKFHELHNYYDLDYIKFYSEKLNKEE